VRQVGYIQELGQDSNCIFTIYLCHTSEEKLRNSTILLLFLFCCISFSTSASKSFLSLSTTTFLAVKLPCFHLPLCTIIRVFCNKFAVLKVAKYTGSFSYHLSYIESTLPLSPKKMMMELLPKFLSTSIVLSIIICSSPLFLTIK